jgi:hypothetical protein
MRLFLFYPLLPSSKNQEVTPNEKNEIKTN